jgi:Immunity protein 40
VTKRHPPTVAAILSRGLDLEDFGSANWGLRRTDALAALTMLHKLRVPLLGGDVWEIKDGRPFHTRDTWYYERKEHESFESFLNQSVERARTYIENYPLHLDDRVLFEIVPASTTQEE